MHKIAIALFGSRVSPRFDCAPRFRFVELDNGTINSSREVYTENFNAAERISKLRELGVTTLICGGIDMVSAGQLDYHGVKIYSWITGQADDALECLLQGKLQPGFMLAAGGRCCGRWRFRQGRGAGPGSGSGNSRGGGRRKGWCGPQGN